MVFTAWKITSSPSPVAISVRYSAPLSDSLTHFVTVSAICTPERSYVNSRGSWTAGLRQCIRQGEHTTVWCLKADLISDYRAHILQSTWIPLYWRHCRSAISNEGTFLHGQLSNTLCTVILAISLKSTGPFTFTATVHSANSGPRRLAGCQIRF